ncbi:hypothetical protein ACFXAE_24585 [Streptomyces sp. NPDC059454]|jgi:hypothetical protein|uniref:hypothetical protein n=1 Tax=Streptomyces sp. NPDC059454 TaxID=3346836 RepID=UPI003675B59E
MGGASPLLKRPEQVAQKITDDFAVPQIIVVPPHRITSGRDPAGPLATDDPFTWLPWRPDEDTDEDEEHESSPAEPQ